MDSHDQENKSHDLAEEEEDILNNLLLEETSDPPSKEREAPLVDRMSHLSIDSSCRTSRASLTVFAPDSVPSMALGTSSRPYSFISPGVSAYHFDFSGSYERSNGDRLSGGHTLPKSAVGVTWSPRGQLLHDRKSLKAIIPASTRYSLCVSFPLRSIHSVRKLASTSLKEYGLKLPEGLLILCRNFQSMKLYIHPHNTYDADGLKELLERKFLTDRSFHEMFAIQYRTAIRHPNPTFLHNRGLPNHFRLPDEIARLGLQDSKLWTVTRVLANHPELCSSYPGHVIVPTCTGDLDYIRGARQYREGRFPTLTWYNRSSGAALLRAASTLDQR